MAPTLPIHPPTHTIHNGVAGTRLLQFKFLLEGGFWRLGEKGEVIKQRNKRLMDTNNSIVIARGMVGGMR